MPVTDIAGVADLAAALKANKSRLVVVDFYATWCGPCKAIAPHVETLSGRYAKEAAFYKVDVDKAPDVAKDAGVQAMPSFGFYGDGKMVELMKGADPRGLEERVKKYSAQFFKSPFSGSGHSLTGSRPASASASASAAATAPATSAAAAGGAAAAAGGASQPARRNPWADPNFMPGKKGAPASGASAAAPPAASSASSAHSTIPAGSKLLNSSAAASSSSSSSAPSASTVPSTAPSAFPAPSAATDAAYAPAPAASNAAAPPATASTHPALQVNADLLQQLRDMGFTDLRAQKALLFTGNKDAEDALNWLMAHQDDADIDEPLQVTGVEKKDSGSGGLPAGVNVDELDEDAQVLYADLMKKKAKQQAAAPSTAAAAASSAAASASASQASGKKAVSDMSSEEKRQWLEERKATVKARKEAEALEKVKSDFKSSKGMTHAMNELKEQREEFERQQAIARRKKEDADKAKQRREVQEKIAADKERRKLEQERTLAALQKAKEEKANGGK